MRAKTVSSMRQPEGNITGVSIMGVDLDAKRLEILAELLPLAVPFFCLQTRPHIASHDRRLTRRGRDGPHAERSHCGSPEQSSGRCAKRRPAALRASTCCPRLCCSRCEGTSLSLQRAWVTRHISVARDSGRRRLIAYGPSLRGAFRQVTTLVDKVLKGAKPSNIPVEQPTRFSLVINLKTAGRLGLTVPPLTLLRADRAIE